MKERAIIVDLDGTLADCDHRVHLVENKKREDVNWPEFYQGMDQDKLNSWCLEIMEAMGDKGVKSIIITGRPSNYKDLTVSWLETHSISYAELYMRDQDDYRDDALIKKDLYQKHVENSYDIAFVLDDRKSVVKMWRDLELTCLQPAWGEF